MDKEKREKSTTLSGKPPTEGYNETTPAPAPINPSTGMHEDYWVLSEEERAKGFIRPVYTKYTHDKCGVVTEMAVALAETYARDPKYYGATFCSFCKNHFPVKEFKWDGTDKIVGS